MNILKNKNYIKLIMIALITCLELSMLSVVYADELTIETKKINDKYIKWLELSDEEREGLIAPQIYVKNIQNETTTYSTFRQRSLGATTKYNLRDSIYLKIKDQMDTAQCWAFATTTQLESYMAKLQNKVVEYSPRHIEYSTVRTFLDGENEYGYNRGVDSGGNAYLSYSYMTSGRGPILEKDMPFVNTSKKVNLSEIQNKEVQGQLEEFTFFPGIYKEKNGNTITYSNGQTGANKIVYTKTQVTNIRNEIKEHIMKYGAVISTTSNNNIQFFSNEKQPISSVAYYCDDENTKADHAVAIIGWDDNYAVTNFNKNHRPSSPGAWLVQNSLGTETSGIKVFDDGLLYISYEDILIEQNISGIIRFNDVDYDKIYQYDPLGMNSVISMTGIDELYAANVFQKGSQDEYLSEVGIYTSGTGNEALEIYVNSQDDDLKKIKKVKTVGKTNSDYITVELDEPIKLTGNNFVVAVKYTNSSGTAEVPVETKLTYNENDKWATATSNSGESYWTFDTRLWFDLKNEKVEGMENMNACIKAFTRKNINQPQTITLTSKKYTINTKTITNVSPNTSLTKFKSNLTTSGTSKLYDSNGQEITSTNAIGTGMQLKITETGNTYTIIVKGDVNGDGKVTGSDLLKVKKDIVGLKKLSGNYKTAGDVNNSGSITSADLLKIKQVICRLIEF